MTDILCNFYHNIRQKVLGMSTIELQSKAFYESLLEGLRGLLPSPEAQAKGWKKKLEALSGLRRSNLDAAFSQKGRNLQARWDDDQMIAFNNGRPHPEDAAMLFALLAWKGAVGEMCKSSGIGLKEFEPAAMAVIDTSLSWLENWLRLEGVARSLVEARGPGAAAQSVREAVRRQAAHFTGKLTHPSVSGVGIITEPDDEPLPYLYAGGLKHGVALDVVTPSSPDTTYRSSLDLWNRWRGGEALGAREEALAQAFDEALRELGTGEDRCSSVDYRLKQLKLPLKLSDGEDSYVVITPLGCPGVAKAISKIKDRIHAARIRLPYGGSKRSNISFHDEITAGLYYDVPTPSDDGYATYLLLTKRGFRLERRHASPLMQAAAAYIEWLAGNSFVSGNISSLATKIDRHNPRLRAVIVEALAQIYSKQRDVELYLGQLEDSQREQAVKALAGIGPIEKAIATSRIDADAIDALADAVVRLLASVIDRNDVAKAVALQKQDVERLRDACRDIAKGMTA